MKFWVVIPARYASSRLPGKPLCKIAGKYMIEHVYQRALESAAERVVIATDDTRIQEAACAFGATVCMTSSHHRSGTDRIAEAVQQLNAPTDILIVNVQGDEPLLPSQLIGQVAEALATHQDADMATLCEPVLEREAVFNANVVKVVCDKQGLACYFSRAAIPWLREEFTHANSFTSGLHFRHIGIYAYRLPYLLYLTQLPVCPLEQAEALEQLRVLYDGGKIYVAQAEVPAGLGIDTPEDLEKVRRLLET